MGAYVRCTSAPAGGGPVLEQLVSPGDTELPTSYNMPGPLVSTPLQPPCPSSKPGRCGGEDRAPTFLILCSWPWRPPSGQQLGVVYVGMGEKGPCTPTP